MAKPTVRLDLTDALSIPCIYTAILPIDIRVNYVDDFGVGREFVLHIQKVKVDSKNIAVTCDENNKVTFMRIRPNDTPCLITEGCSTNEIAKACKEGGVDI